jgi:hypothetical protein
VSEWLLLSANSASFQLYHGESKLIFNEMVMRSALFYTNTPNWLFILLDRQSLSHNVLYWVYLAWAGFELTTLVVIGTDCIGICKSNYRTMTTAPSHLASTLYLIYFNEDLFIIDQSCRWKHIQWNDITNIKAISQWYYCIQRMFLRNFCKWANVWQSGKPSNKTSLCIKQSCYMLR